MSPRPREPHVPEVEGICPKHGRQRFRVHAKGWKRGVQQFRARCPLCHNEYEMERRRRESGFTE